jgi:prophage regulatory protein
MPVAELRLCRLPDVLARVGVKRSTLYRWIAEKRFPGPVHAGDNVSAWLESDVTEWINRRVAESTIEGTQGMTAIAWLTDRDIAAARQQERTHIWRLTQQGMLPKPVKLGANCTRWPAHEIEVIDRARLAGASDGEVRKLVCELMIARTAAGKVAA